MFKNFIEYCKQERLSLVVGFGYTVFGAFIGGVIGAWITINIISPTSIQLQFSANLSSVGVEILENQNAILLSIKPNIDKLVTNATTVADKENNLAATSKMKLLSEISFDQLATSYYQLPTSVRLANSSLFAYLEYLYGQYSTLNNNISLLGTTVGASLGFQGQIFPQYLKYMKQQIESAIASTTQIANEIYNTKFFSPEVRAIFGNSSTTGGWGSSYSSSSSYRNTNCILLNPSSTSQNVICEPY